MSGPPPAGPRPGSGAPRWTTSMTQQRVAAAGAAKASPHTKPASSSSSATSSPAQGALSTRPRVAPAFSTANRASASSATSSPVVLSAVTDTPNKANNAKSVNGRPSQDVTTLPSSGAIPNVRTSSGSTPHASTPVNRNPATPRVSVQRRIASPSVKAPSTTSATASPATSTLPPSDSASAQPPAAPFSAATVAPSLTSPAPGRAASGATISLARANGSGPAPSAATDSETSLAASTSAPSMARPTSRRDSSHRSPSLRSTPRRDTPRRDSSAPAQHHDTSPPPQHPPSGAGTAEASSPAATTLQHKDRKKVRRGWKGWAVEVVDELGNVTVRSPSPEPERQPGAPPRRRGRPRTRPRPGDEQELKQEDMTADVEQSEGVAAGERASSSKHGDTKVEAGASGSVTHTEEHDDSRDADISLGSMEVDDDDDYRPTRQAAGSAKRRRTNSPGPGPSKRTKSDMRTSTGAESQTVINVPAIVNARPIRAARRSETAPTNGQTSSNGQAAAHQGPIASVGQRAASLRDRDPTPSGSKRVTRPRDSTSRKTSDTPKDGSGTRSNSTRGNSAQAGQRTLDEFSYGSTTLAKTPRVGMGAVYPSPPESDERGQDAAPYRPDGERERQTGDVSDTNLPPPAIRRLPKVADEARFLIESTAKRREEEEARRAANDTDVLADEGNYPQPLEADTYNGSDELAQRPSSPTQLKSSDGRRKVQEDEAMSFQDGYVMGGDIADEWDDYAAAASTLRRNHHPGSRRRSPSMEYRVDARGSVPRMSETEHHGSASLHLSREDELRSFEARRHGTPDYHDYPERRPRSARPEHDLARFEREQLRARAQWEDSRRYHDDQEDRRARESSWVNPGGARRYDEYRDDHRDGRREFEERPLRIQSEADLFRDPHPNGHMSAHYAHPSAPPPHYDYPRGHPYGPPPHNYPPHPAYMAPYGYHAPTHLVPSQSQHRHRSSLEAGYHTTSPQHRGDANEYPYPPGHHAGLHAPHHATAGGQVPAPVRPAAPAAVPPKAGRQAPTPAPSGRSQDVPSPREGGTGNSRSPDQPAPAHSMPHSPNTSLSYTGVLPMQYPTGPAYRAPDSRPPTLPSDQRQMVLAPRGNEIPIPDNEREAAWARAHAAGFTGLDRTLEENARGFVENVKNNLRTLVGTYFNEPSHARDAFLERIGQDLCDLGWQLTDGSDGALYSRGSKMATGPEVQS